MNKSLRLAALGMLLPVAAFAVYAPIPEQEQGKALSFRLGASVYHDSNIFGAATGEIDSMVYSLLGRIAYNSSATDQTFVSASYTVNNDYVADRPTSKNLTSHAFSARLAHSFSDATNIDLNAYLQFARNPESLLAGIPVNTDQSYQRHQLDGRFVTTAGQKTGLVFKLRNIGYNYDDAGLAAQLDRLETMAGVEVKFAVLPETKLVGEYRYLDIAYDTAGALKDKRSHFLLAGVDYHPDQHVQIGVRAGGEDRRREGAPDTSSPYLEFTARYSYSEGSFISGGYSFSIEEPSDTLLFTDSKVSRFFVNLQHRLSPLVTASAALTYEPAELQGRAPTRDVDEDTFRAGFGLSWLPNRNWSLSATCDFDRVNSDLGYREQSRARLGVSARFSF